MQSLRHWVRYVEFESGLGQTTGEMPGFMQSEVPTFVDEPPEQGKVLKEAAG